MNHESKLTMIRLKRLASFRVEKRIVVECVVVAIAEVVAVAECVVVVVAAGYVVVAIVVSAGALPLSSSLLHVSSCFRRRCCRVSSCFRRRCRVLQSAGACVLSER